METICLHGVNLLLGIAPFGSVAVAMCAPPIHRLARAASVLAIAIALAAGETAGARADVGVGSWSPTGAMPQGWTGGSAVTLTGGSVLAVAGVSGDASTSTDLYDPHRGTWATAPNLPSSASFSTAVALSDGGALLVGGATCNNVERRCLPDASTYRLNPSDSAWVPTASMLVARVHPIVVRLAGGRVLVAGGFGDDCPATVADGYSCQPLASAEVYDPVRNRWSTTQPMPQPRGGASAALLSDGTVLVVGGDGGGDAIRYDARSETWATAGQTAPSRTGSLLFALPGDRALALEGDEPYAGFFGSLGGAATARTPRCNPSSETFEGASNAWMVSLTEPGGIRYCPTGVLLAGGQILLNRALNYSPLGVALTNPFLLDAKQRCWSMTGQPAVRRDGDSTLVALRDGRALVFGGYESGSSTGYQRLSSAEIYTPGPPRCLKSTITRPPGSPLFTGATLTRRSHLVLAAGGFVSVPEQCPKNATRRCLGHVRLDLQSQPSRTYPGSHCNPSLLGEGPFAIPTGEAASVTVSITRNMHALRTLIGRERRVAIVVTTGAYDETGQAATTTVATTLVRQRR